MNLIYDTEFTVEAYQENILCPVSHFECHENDNCIPIYLRCNSKYYHTVEIQFIHYLKTQWIFFLGQ